MAISQAIAHQRKGCADRDCPAVACLAVGSKLYCAACSGTAVKMCAGCRATHYCCRACQKKDWHRHRNDCRKVSVTVRAFSGQGTHLENLSLFTSVGELEALVLPWAYQQLPPTVKEARHMSFFDIDLVYDGNMLDNPSVTLADIGVIDGDELLSACRLDEPPPLAFPSDSDE